MRLTYEKHPRFNDATVYSITVKKNENGEHQLGPRQMKTLAECSAWRLRTGSFNGPDVNISETGIVYK